MNDLLMIYSLVDLNCLDPIGVNILILLGILDFALHPDNESFDKRYMDKKWMSVLKHHYFEQM